MRFWPSRRRPVTAAPPLEDLLTTEDVLRPSVEDVLTVHERQIHGGVIAYRGELRVAPARAVALLQPRFRPFGFTPFVRADGAGQFVVQAVRLGEGAEPRPRVRVNVVLFVLTLASTLIAGACGGLCLAFPWDVLSALTSPTRLLAGFPFAATLMSILLTHEFGHYLTARRYKAAVSLPYFIPAPPPLAFGTLGAIIRMRSPGRDRNALFDIAAAGPIAGLAVAVPAVLLGLGWSRIAPLPQGEFMAVQFGDSLLMRLLVYLKFGPIPSGMDVFIHPVALAGWVGFFVTALNLFPVGQLDGGRIAYALFGRHHRLVGVGTVAATVALGVITRSPNWFVWAALVVFFVGFHHHPPLDDVTPLSRGRWIVGLVCLILFVLLIPPIPIDVQ